MHRQPRTLEEVLSVARMSPYLMATDQDWGQALRLYEWNTRVSAAFFESVHYVEVGLRNALYEAALARFGPSWLSASSTVLTPRSRKAVAVALDHAGGPSAPPGNLVAELPFGFWWSLLSDEYNRRLWQPALRNAFEGQVRRRKLHADLAELRLLRNRIAHHEPIHRRDVDEDFARVVRIAIRIADVLGRHIHATSRVQAVISERPPPGIA